MMKVAVIGTGAMGSIFSCRLGQVADVMMLGTWRQQIDIVNTTGLWLEDPAGQRTLYRLQATADPGLIGPVELALILVKGWQTSRAADQAQQLLTSDGIALTLQNGLGNLEILQDKVGSHRSALGVTSEGATMLQPGHVRHAGRGKTHLATNHDKKDRLERVAQLFNSAGFVTEVVADPQSLVWGKLAVNAGINPLTALLEITNGELLNHQATIDLMGLAAQEVADLARRLTIELPYPSAVDQVIHVARVTSNNRSSMLQDIARGMPTEIDTISGAIVRLGQANGVATPVNQALFTLVKAKVAGIPWRSQIETMPPSIRERFVSLFGVVEVP